MFSLNILTKLCMASKEYDTQVLRTSVMHLWYFFVILELDGPSFHSLFKGVPRVPIRFCVQWKKE